MTARLATAAALGEFERLTEEARRLADPALEALVVRRRYDLGRQLLAEGGARGQSPLPEQDVGDPFPEVRGRPPEIGLDELGADLLRGVLKHHGSVLVHDFFPTGTIERLRRDTDEMADAFDRWMASKQSETSPSWFAPLEAPGAELPLSLRAWCGALGCYYAGDSPRSMLDLIEAFNEAGMPELLNEYMREPSLLALEKTSLRRVPGNVPSALHQDGMRFGVDKGLVNVWVALCHCGTRAPTIGIVPKRPAEILRLDEHGLVSWEIDAQALDEFRGDLPLLELELAPGDAVIFDEMLVHGTIARPEMPDLRYGADAWFFPVSGFPEDLYRPYAYASPPG